MKNIKVLISFFLFFLIISCATKEDKVTQKDIKNFEKLEEYFQLENYDAYLIESSKFIKNNKDSYYYPYISYNRGLIFFKREDYKNSLIEMEEAISRNSNIYNKALYYNSFCKYKVGSYSDSFKSLNRININEVPDFKLRIHLLRGYLYANLNRELDKVKEYLKVYDLTDDLDIKNKMKISIFSSLESDIDLKDLVTDSKKSSLNSYIWFFYIRKLIDRGNIDLAKSNLKDFLITYPDHEYANYAETELNNLKELDIVEGLNVGVILPLTGRMAAYGQRSLMGVQLAAGVFTEQKIPIKLSIKDSKSDPDIARIALNELIEKDHIVAVIGDIIGDNAEIISDRCSILGIPNFTLSHRSSLKKDKNYIFNITMNYEDQIDRLLDYVIDELSILKFGILYPEDNYGKDLSFYFWDKVLLRGGEVNAVASYSLETSDFKDEIQDLLGLKYPEARTDEYNEIVEKIKEEYPEDYQKRLRDIKLPPIKTFDVLFIPDSAKVVSKIAPYLAYYDSSDILLLGTNTWNSLDLIKRGGKFVEGAIFVDGFSLNPKKSESRRFVKKFKEIFEREPGLLEAQAYDATAILIKSLSNLYKNGEDKISRDALNREILSSDNYQGATGKISFDSLGGIKKSLFLLEVKKGKINEIDNN